MAATVRTRTQDGRLEMLAQKPPALLFLVVCSRSVPPSFADLRRNSHRRLRKQAWVCTSMSLASETRRTDYVDDLGMQYLTRPC